MKGEIESQIRDTALAKLIRGLLLLVVGWLLWRYHAHRTELYRDGLQARPKPVAPVAAAPSVVAEATMPISTLPPPAAE